MPPPAHPHGHASPLADPARDTAIRALARQARAFPDLLPTAFDDQLALGENRGHGPLRPLDRSFAHAIYHTAVRHWLTLAWLLNREISQKGGFDALEPRARAVLLAGAAQLIYIDRVPAHAALNHAVEWAKTVIRPGAGGLVNAVLRKIAAARAASVTEPGPWPDAQDALPLSDGRVLRSPLFRLPDDPLDRLSIATSNPKQLLEHWRKSCTTERLIARSLHGLVEPPIVLNIGHAGSLSDNDLLATSPHTHPDHAVFNTEAGVLLTDLLTRNPGVWVQDSAAAGAVRSIAAVSPAPRVIVDLCAGRGTKTRQLAATFPNAEIIATDVDAVRLAALGAVFRQHASVTTLDYAMARDRAMGRADLVVLDVPCTNSGVLPRRPEARYRFTKSSLDSLAGVQRQILADSIPLLSRSGGQRRILYSTCSLESEENDAQHRWMCQEHGFVDSLERFQEPSGDPGGDPAHYADGAYSVLLSPR